jgi:glycosyltransferase involved in cell wall biosynthesis
MLREDKFPLISVIIPTYNEEVCIASCLESIFSQDYPKDRLEIIIVDDFSSDNTRQLAMKYNSVLIDSGHKDPQVSKMLGIRHSKGEIICLFDADFILKSREWFKKMIAPFFDDKSIVACVTGYHSNSGDPPINRYLNFDSNQRDPIYMFFSPSINKSIIRKKGGYFLCEFKLNNIPPMAGGCVYRKDIIFALVSNFGKFLDIDSFVLLVENGFNKFAYVPEAGIYHSHAHTLKELCKVEKI